MMPLTSYTGPLRRDQIARRVIAATYSVALIALLTAAVVFIAHITLQTLAAIPTLTDPALVPGCC